MARGGVMPGASVLWIVLLTVASILTTLALACATPFAALAALAALHMRRRDGVVLMLLSWAASQAIGFGMLHYPHDANTLGWAAALAVAAVVASVAASMVRAKSGVARLVMAYVVAFAVFTAVAVGASLLLGGTETLVQPALLLRQFARNGVILIGLFALYHGLVAFGVPAARPRLAMA